MLTDFLTGLGIAIIVYLFLNIIFQRKFIDKLEDSSKVMTTGIGSYFLAWIVTWVLFFSFFHPSG